MIDKTGLILKPKSTAQRILTTLLELEAAFPPIRGNHCISYAPTIDKMATKATPQLMVYMHLDVGFVGIQIGEEDLDQGGPVLCRKVEIALAQINPPRPQP